MKALSLVRNAALGLALVTIATAAVGQQYPSKTIRIITHSTGGGAAVARVIAQKLTENTGQQVVVDSRPGGGSLIASEVVLRSPPDGYTLYAISTTFTTVPALRKKLPFDPVRDFVPVTRVSISPLVLVVHPSLPVASVQELIKLARAKPGAISFGSAGIASPSHLATELFNAMAKIKMLHVPYKGSAGTITAIMSGEVALTITSPINAGSSALGRKLKRLGVTSTTRSPAFPDLPTIAEAGLPGYEFLLWNAILLPGGTPQPVVDRLHAELSKVAAAKDVMQRLQGDGAQPVIDKPGQFAVYLQNEIAKSKQVVNDFLGIQPQ